MSKVFFISDPHFYHANIIRFENRPFKNVQEMNDKLIENWNNTVSKEDQVYILGDFSFGTKEETLGILRKLNGQKFLIKGNHDYSIKDAEVARCFTWIKDYYMLKHNGLKIVLFHYPIQVWDCQHHGALHFYGHIHSNIGSHRMEYEIKNSYNVGADVNNLAPIELNEILKKLRYVG